MKILIVLLWVCYFSLNSTIINANTKMIEQDLSFNKPIKKIPKISFIDEVENNYNIKDFEGQIVILYFWASWCIECINELKRLDILKSKLLYENITDVEIIPISIDFKQPEFLYSIYKDAKVKNLGLFIDRNKRIIKTIGVSGVPFTIILDKDLREIMRTNKGIKWANQAVIDQLIRLRGGPVKKYQSDAPLLLKENDKEKENDIFNDSDI